jgi:hypothetical protein
LILFGIILNKIYLYKKKEIMKTTLFIIALIISQISFAGNDPATERRMPDNISKHINNIGIYPDFAKEKGYEGLVQVAFTVNEGGELTIIGLEGNSEELNSYVEQEIKSIRLCPFDKSVGQSYLVSYNFSLM